MATNRKLTSWKVWIPVLLAATPAVAGYFLLRNAVEFFGSNERSCTGAGRSRNCSTPEGGAQIAALFGVHFDDGYVSSPGLVWAARACFAVYGLLIVYFVVRWLVERVSRHGALRRSGMRGPKARERKRVEQARRAKVAGSLQTRRDRTQSGRGDGVDLSK